MAHISVMGTKAAMGNTTDDSTKGRGSCTQDSIVFGIFRFTPSWILGVRPPMGYWLFRLGSGLTIFMFGILLG